VVGPFYAFWSSFCTNKSYVWEEKYDTREAPDRRCRRAMESENKKLRDAARRERNEEIRNLVAYVKKRDKRVQAYKKKLEERHAEIEAKTKQKREEELRERKKQLENYKEAGWSAMSGLEKDLQQLEAHLDEHFGEVNDGPLDENDELCENGEEELYLDDLYCVACNKSFKSDKAFSNHEKSRKHKEMVAIIAQEMQDEDQDGEADEGGGEPSADVGEGNSISSSEEDTEGQKQKLSKKQKKKRRQKVAVNSDEDQLSEQVEALRVTDETPEKSSTKSKKARRKGAKLAESSKTTTVTEENVKVNGVSHSSDDKQEAVVSNDSGVVDNGLDEVSDNTVSLATESKKMNETNPAQPQKDDSSDKNKTKPQKVGLKTRLIIFTIFRDIDLPS
uniref:C2H2-type domain-containing protein n=1 Tax=Biomphalaria glabrata TaxID=6526 RepID=A0A2C9LFZ6_BIOGL